MVATTDLKVRAEAHQSTAEIGCCADRQYATRHRRLDADAESRPPHTMTDLSKMQAACVARVGLGESNKEIGRALGIAPATAKKHLEIAMLKLGVRNRTQLAMKVAAQ